MSYSSIAYLCFFMTALIFYTIVPIKHKWKVLLVFSYLFYYISAGKYIIFILISTLSIYVAGLTFNKIDDGYNMARKCIPKENKKEYKEIIAWQKKTVCVITVLLNFGLLVFLKYFNFLGDTFAGLLGLFHLHIEAPSHSILLPLGISFYTMSATSYVIDVYRGKYRASDNLGKVALFLAFFPHIVEGPIGRFDLLGDQLYEGHRFDYKNFTFGLQLVCFGLFKKMVIADRANMYVNTVFNGYQDYSGPYVVMAMLLYTLQLYAEFSGCMDIVMGSAQIFGVSLSSNFERPFISRTVSEFWRRWHITLGAWFKDYVFYSVSLSKTFMKISKKARTKCNQFLGSIIPTAVAMFVVWFGTGIWHGASWKYIMYGLYYYLIIMLGLLTEPFFRKLYEKHHINRESAVYKILQTIRTFLFVNVGMLMFRADTLKAFGHMFVSMFSGWSFETIRLLEMFDVRIDIYDMVVLIFGALLLFVIGLYKEKGHHIREELAQKNIALRWAVYYVLVFSVVIFGAFGHGYDIAGFIYAQF